MRPGWPVRVLAERLADASRRLEELQVGELAVRASFEVSLQVLEHGHDPLDQAAAVAFGLLGLPDGPDLDVTAAARLLDQPEPGARALLERLVDAQLLASPRLGRYQFHDLLRLFARQHAARRHPEAERLAALGRLFGFYTTTAWCTFGLLRPGDHRLAGADPRWAGGGLRLPDATAALTWLEAERPNLLAAIRQVAATPSLPAALAVQLTRAMYGLYLVHGHWQDAVQANQTALELAEREGDRTAQAQARNDLGVAFWRLGRFQEAIACYRDGLALHRELGDRSGQALSLNNLGIAYGRWGRYREAIAHHRDALGLLEELGDRSWRAEVLRDLGDALRGAGSVEQAREAWREALAIGEELQLPEADEVRSRLDALR